jgi:hypothetical protein
MYQVVMLNDDFTPMEFVIVVLQEFFGKDREAATQIMLKIHLDGRGVCGCTPATWPPPRSSRCCRRPTRRVIRCRLSASLLNNADRPDLE